MPVLEMAGKVDDRYVVEAEEEDWSAHNNCLHIPNAETIRAMEDARAGRNLFGPFATAQEAVDHMLAHMDEDEDE